MHERRYLIPIHKSVWKWREQGGWDWVDGLEILLFIKCGHDHDMVHFLCLRIERKLRDNRFSGKFEKKMKLGVRSIKFFFLDHRHHQSLRGT